jgi:hypothetical protein
MNSAVFIYHKEGKIKVLDLSDSKQSHIDMVENSWVHTTTLNPCVWIEYLFNQCEVEDLFDNVKSLSKI